MKYLKTYTAGEDVENGEWCYYKSDSKMWGTDADVAATVTGLIALATATIAADADGAFQLSGDYTTSGLTAGTEYFLSTTKFGICAVGTLATGDFARYVGTATATTNLRIDISPDWFEVA